LLKPKKGYLEQIKFGYAGRFFPLQREKSLYINNIHNIYYMDFLCCYQCKRTEMYGGYQKMKAMVLNGMKSIILGMNGRFTFKNLVRWQRFQRCHVF